MKICHVTNYLPGFHSHSGGAEQACLRVARAAASSGTENNFLTTKFDAEGRGVVDKVSEIRTLNDFSGFASKYLEIFKWYIFQFDPLAYLSALKYFRKEKPDVVNFHNFQFLTFSVLAAAKKSGLPACLSIYDYWYFCPATTLLDSRGVTCREFHGIRCLDCLPGKMRIVQRAFLAFRKKVFDFFLKKIDAFIVLSQSSKSILSAYGIKEDRIFVVPLPPAVGFGVPPEKTAQESKEATVLFMGWLQRRKGLHILLEAMKEVWKEIPSAKLRIIVQKVKWEKDYEELMEKKLSEMPRDKIEYSAGQKSPDEIKSAVANSSVIVIPEQWENMSPLLVIEAMQSGKAIVASSIGGIPEYIKDGETGLLAEYSNPMDFAGKIKTLLSDGEKARLFGAGAQKSVMEFYKTADVPGKLKNVYDFLRRSAA